VQLHGQGSRLWLFGFGLLGVLLIGGSGALISLGDFLAFSLSAQYDALVAWLVGLRLWHPLIAIGVGAYLLWLGLVLAQWAVGFINVWLRVPLWTQITHLLLADLIWIALLLWTASALAQPEAQSAAASSQPRGAAAG